jgi:electron transfer flavoprotein beta subunit
MGYFEGLTLWFALGSVMQLLVCMKQVPEKDSRYKIDQAGSATVEEDLVFETNESDVYALEEALRLKEKFGGEVVVLSLGEERVLKTIKNALAMGADRAFHLTGPAFRGGDAFVTAQAISRAARKENFDLIFTGVQSEDMAYAQTGTILAQVLGYPHATIVMSVDISLDARTAQIKRELESNLFERVEIPLPAVLTIQSGINHPRYATLKGIMLAKKKEIRTLSARELGLESHELGEQGSKVDQQRLFFPEKRKKTVMIGGTPEEAAETLMEKLRKEARVL